jgi:hypothetical protein
MQIIKEDIGHVFSVQAEEKQLFTGLAQKILKSLVERPKYPKEISRELKVNEQKVYYHVRCLEKKGFLRIAGKEERGGALAKLYELSSPAFFVRFGSFSQINRLPKFQISLEPFVSNGNLNAKIIVGSPNPHGPERARSRDLTFAIDLALFLGTFLNKVQAPAVIEDKDAHIHDLRENLIIIGGPITNKVTKMFNDKLPVKFDRQKNIISGKKIYRHDECGFIARADNPLMQGKKLLVIAGKRYSGTKAAVLAFITKFDEIEKSNFTIVEGQDNDGDGEVDSVHILE